MLVNLQYVLDLAEKGNFAMTVVYHPASLLRNPSQKDAMLTDMKAIRARLDSLG